MIHVDRRAGSAELWPVLTRAGLPARLDTLEFGDCCFLGHGPAGPHSALVGVERKVVRDLVQSLTSGRLSGHQVPGLVGTYSHRWLVVEGGWRTDPHGFATMPSPRPPRPGQKRPWESLGLKTSAIEGYLLTLTLRAGIHVQRTRDLEDTAQWLGGLYRWWVGKEWADHRAHLALHQPDTDARLWVAPNTVQRMAACLPGIGGEKSQAVAEAFRTPLEMVMASPAEWQRIPGIGKGIAGRVTRILHNGD